jgi:hypothetical protein
VAQEQFETHISRPDLTTTLTVSETANPLRGEWVAFDTELDGVETESFDSESAAIVPLVDDCRAVSRRLRGRFSLIPGRLCVIRNSNI